jgi:hypothetical protein
LVSVGLAMCAVAGPAWQSALGAPVRQQINVTGYVITADLDPTLGKLTATADVTFTALEDLTTVTFELNNGLAITKLTDKSGAALNSERLTANSTVRITLQAPLAKGSVNTYHFEYSGILTGSDTSPVEGIKLAAVADPISILLYPGRWFPMTGLFTDRFTTQMHITAPTGYTVVGSGNQGQVFCVVEAGLSGDDYCGQVSAGGGWVGVCQHSGVCNGKTQGERSGVCRAGGAGV